jgi:hypothetical protein
MTWISVKDQLPEEDQFVLVISKNDNQMFVVQFYTSQKISNSAPIILNWEILFSDEEMDIRITRVIGYILNVTHWMPLPEPPQE